MRYVLRSCAPLAFILNAAACECLRRRLGWKGWFQSVTEWLQTERRRVSMHLCVSVCVHVRLCLLVCIHTCVCTCTCTPTSLLMCITLTSSKTLNYTPPTPTWCFLLRSFIPSDPVFSFTRPSWFSLNVFSSPAFSFSHIKWKKQFELIISTHWVMKVNVRLQV